MAIGFWVGFSYRTFTFGLAAGLGILISVYLPLIVLESLRSGRKWKEYHNRLLLEGREPRYVDETIDIPSAGLKQYSIELDKTDAVQVITESDGPLTVEVRDVKIILTPGHPMTPSSLLRGSMSNVKQAFLKYKAKQTGVYSIDIRNETSTSARVKVIIRHLSIPT